MIKYLEPLYLTEKTEKKIDKIKWKLACGAGLVHIHLIMLAENEQDVFDIYPACLFKQRLFRKRDYIVAGVAENKEAAIQLVQKMIEESHEISGSYDHIREDFLSMLNKAERH